MEATMKTRFTVLITLLLLPCLVQGQIISKVPQSDVSVMKNVIGSTTEYSLTMYDRNSGYNSEIRLGDFEQAVSLLTKMGDEYFRNNGKMALNNGYEDSAEYKNTLSGSKWSIYRQNGQILYLSLYEIKASKEVIMKDRLMDGSSTVTPSNVSITITERPPSFYLKRSAQRMGFSLGLSALSALSGVLYSISAADNTTYGIQGSEITFAVVSLGTGVATLCTVIGSIIDLHRAGSALERIQVTSGGVAFKF
jgi:hypothetical protein